MSKCELCRQGNESVNVKCYKCRSIFHLHMNQVDQVGSGSVILADCPSCQATNSFLKRNRRRLAPWGPVIYAGQTWLDLRARPGQGKYQPEGVSRGRGS